MKQQADHDYPEMVEVEHHWLAEMYPKELLHLPGSAHESGSARCCRSIRRACQAITVR